MHMIRKLSFIVFLLIPFAGQAAAGAMTPAEILARADEARGNLADIMWEIKIVA